MDWIRSLQCAINYIEEHITEPMDYKKVAGQMNISEFYFHRIFTIDYEPTYEMDIEDYPDGDITSDDYKCNIWISVRKK